MNGGFDDVATYGDFQKLLKRGGLLLLDVRGEGCPSCDYDKAAVRSSCPSDMMLVSMSVDSVPEALSKLQVDHIPTLLLFRNGRRWRAFGQQPAASGGNVVDWLRALPLPGMPAVPAPTTSGAATTVHQAAAVISNDNNAHRPRRTAR